MAALAGTGDETVVRMLLNSGAHSDELAQSVDSDSRLEDSDDGLEDSDDGREDSDDSAENDENGEDDMDPQRTSSWGLLHYAAFRGHHAIVKLLLERAIETERRTVEGWTALHLAIKEGHQKVAAELLRAGASPFSLDRNGHSPLMMVTIYDYKVDLLGEIMTSMHMESDGKKPPLCKALGEAAAVGNIRAMRLLLSLESPLSCEHSIPPLHRAAIQDHDEAVSLLLSRGADPDVKDPYNGTPLLHCYITEEIMTQLLKCGADPNIKNNAGQTPLFSACIHDKSNLVCLLLDWGADETAWPLQQVVDRTHQIFSRVDHQWLTLDSSIQMLKRAPANRKWSRRGWLIMYRARRNGTTPERDSSQNGSSSRKRLARLSRITQVSAARLRPRFSTQRRDDNVPFRDTVRRSLVMEDSIFRQMVAFL